MIRGQKSRLDFCTLFLEKDLVLSAELFVPIQRFVHVCVPVIGSGGRGDGGEWVDAHTDLEGMETGDGKYRDGLSLHKSMLMSTIKTHSYVCSAVHGDFNSKGDVIGENHLAEGEGMGTNGGQEHGRNRRMDHGTA